MDNSCGICFEEGIEEVGQLDCCDHRFCFNCIFRWVDTESRCPLCKARITTITQRKIASGLEADASSSDSASDDLVRHRILGQVIAVHAIPERNQRPDTEGDEYFGSDDDEDDPMDSVFCERCGLGSDEHCLILCDSCDRGWHTYCADLEEIPEDEWYCEECAEVRTRRPGLRSGRGAAESRGGGASRSAGPGRVTRSRSRDGASRQRGRLQQQQQQQRHGVADGPGSALLSSSAPAETPARRRRRFMRRQAGGPVDAGSTADFLDVLEARANNHSAAELPTAAHRRVENNRRNWDAIRSGQATFALASGSGSGAGRSPETLQPAQPRAHARDGERPEDAWAALETLKGRRDAESESRSASDIRSALAQAHREGRQLGPSGRLNRQHLQPGPSRRGSGEAASSRRQEPSLPRGRAASPRLERRASSGSAGHVPPPRALAAQARREPWQQPATGRAHSPLLPDSAGGRRAQEQQPLPWQAQPLRMPSAWEPAAKPAVWDVQGRASQPAFARPDGQPGPSESSQTHAELVSSRAAHAEPGRAQVWRPAQAIPPMAPAHLQHLGYPQILPHRPGISSAAPAASTAGAVSLPAKPPVPTHQRGSSDDSSSSRANLGSAGLGKRQREDVLRPASWQEQRHTAVVAGQQLLQQKHEAAARVKSLLKPLLVSGLVTKEQFKEAARLATHAIYGSSSSSARPTAEVLAEILADQLDLSAAAIAVLRAQ